MQQQLDCLQEWATKNNIKLKLQKCQIMISCFQIGNSVIIQTNCVKLLGIQLQVGYSS